MTKPIDQIVNETMESLNSKLVGKASLTQEEATTLIQECFNTAFAQVSNEDRKKLYKKFSLILHPDKLTQNKKEEKLYAALNKVNIADLPFKILEEYKEDNFFNKIASDPIKGTQGLLSFLLKKLAPIFGEYQRYPQPLRFIVNTLSWMVNIAIILGLIAVAIPVIIGAVAFLIVDKIQRVLINTLSANQYNIELDHYKNDPAVFNEAKNQFLDSYRAVLQVKNPAIAKMSNDEIMNLYSKELFTQKVQTHYATRGVYPTEQEENTYQQQVKDEINNSIKSTISVTGIRNLALVAKAMFVAVARPLPEGVLGKMAAIFVIKPLQVLAIPFVLTAAFAVELARWATTAVILGAIAAAVAIKVASLFVLNSPLYLLDALRFVGNAVKACFERKPAGDQENQKGNEFFSSHARPMPKPESKSTSSADVEPGIFPALFKSSTDLKSQDRDYDNRDTPAFTA